MSSESKHKVSLVRIAASIPGFAIYIWLAWISGGSYNSAIGISALLINLWIAEPIPVWMSSILPLVLLPAHGVLNFESSLKNYFNNTIYLFFGGFLLAYSVEKWHLHKRIAFRLLALTGDNPKGIVWGMMLSTCLISMWISNTATAIMMLPVAISIVNTIKDKHNKANKAFFTCMMLGIAYGANIGGIATLIGTPPNLVYKGYASSILHQDVSFLKWMLIGIPLSILMLWIAYQMLVNLFFKVRIHSLPEVAELLDRQAEALGKMKTPEKRSLILFASAAFFWIFAQPLNLLLKEAGAGFKIEEYGVALFFGLILFLIPSGSNEKSRLLKPIDLKSISWSILILFGGGMCMAKGLESTGAIAAAGEWIKNSQSDNFPLLLLIVIATALFLTELMSNVALAQIYIPVVFGIAATLQGGNPHQMGIPVAIACSFAFMFPISTPPNAVVFSSGKITIGQMALSGLVLNTAGVLLLWLCGMYIIPYLF